MGNELNKDQEKRVNEAASKAFDNLEAGRQKDDLGPVIADIAKAREQMSPKEYDAFLKKLNKEADGMLPNVEIIGTKLENGQRQLVVADNNNEQTTVLRKDESEKLDEVRAAKDKGKVEHRGNVEVELNAKGELTRFKTADGKELWFKGGDGHWYSTTKEGTMKQDIYTDVSVDKDGSIRKVWIDKWTTVERPNGSTQHIGPDGSGVTYDSGGKNHDYRPEATTDAQGRSRKFHYDENERHKVIEIEGNLGKWERKTDDKGQPYWENQNTKAVWKGDFKVEVNGDLTFKGRNGVVWSFTREGKDILKKRPA